MSLLAAVPAYPQAFECRDVEPSRAGHHHVHQYLTDQLGKPPVEFGYCVHEYSPRWVARWEPFEEVKRDDGRWQRYATARCWDRSNDFFCQITEHVVAGNSHVVVDIRKCEIDISTVAEIHAAAAGAYPGFEMVQIAYTVVEDGGAWSAADYGYEVRLAEPPEFEGGVVRHFINRCNAGQCGWQDGGGTASWIGGISELSILRRQNNDPMIEYVEP